MKIPTTLPKQEELLADYALRLRRHCTGRQALHLRLSGLQPLNRKAQHLGIAAALFAPLARRFEGQIFRLGNADIVFIGKDLPQGELDDAATKIRYMFRDDPFAEQAVAPQDDQTAPAFYRIYNLESEYRAFADCARKLQEASQQLAFIDPTVVAMAARDAAAPPARYALTPRALAQLEQALEHLDLAGVLRKRYAYAVIGDLPPRAVMCKRQVSLPALQKALMPDHDLAADKWLLGRLQAQLDRRMLAALCDVDLGSDLPLTIDMQTESILSKDFPAFITGLRQRSGKPVLVETPAAAALGHMAGFNFARNFLHGHGHKIALGDLDLMLFTLLALAPTGADFYKVRWLPDYRDWLKTDGLAAFERAVQSVGAPHVVLVNCEDAESVDCGLKAGIRLFEGSFLDRNAVCHRPVAATG